METGGGLLRYADDFVVIVKGTKAQARAIREECRAFLEGELKLTLNWKLAHWLARKHQTVVDKSGYFDYK